MELACVPMAISMMIQTGIHRIHLPLQQRPCMGSLSRPVPAPSSIFHLDEEEGSGFSSCMIAHTNNKGKIVKHQKIKL